MIGSGQMTTGSSRTRGMRKAQTHCRLARGENEMTGDLGATATRGGGLGHGRRGGMRGEMRIGRGEKGVPLATEIAMRATSGGE